MPNRIRSIGSLRSIGSIALVSAALLLVACGAETDRSSYPAGHPGQVAFRNPLATPLYLSGCSHFDYQQLVGGVWLSRDPAQVCVWEGFAQAVAPGAAVHDALETQREPGTWRVLYPVGIGCSEDEPLGEAHCAMLVEIASNDFEVGGAGCAIGGCSSQLCGEKAFLEQVATTCEWREEYACYRNARCGRFGPDGACGWEQTPELRACLADPPPLD